MSETWKIGHTWLVGHSQARGEAYFALAMERRLWADCVEKPLNWPFVENGFVDTFGLIGVQRACGGATKLAR
jgi:hypothetical protein